MRDENTDKNKPVKLCLSVSQQVLEALKEVAAIQEVSMTEALRRAIGTEKFLLHERELGNKVLIEDKKKRLRELVLR
jgi:hypothetical protein